MAAKKTQNAQKSGENTLSLEALNRATLARQMLLAREKTTPVKVLERLLAIQAQWPKPPFLALWSRIEGFKRDDLSSAARKNLIVRGTSFRGTIFITTAKDYALFRRAIEPTLERGVTSITKKAIAEKDFDRIVQIGRTFFAEPHTFDELRDELDVQMNAGSSKSKKKVPPGDIRLMAYLVRMRVPLIQVATADQPWGWHGACGFALAESSIADKLAPAPELDALVLRYLAALGPASIADAQMFTGVTKLKDCFERLRPRLVAFRDASNGKELFDLPNAQRPDPESIDSDDVPVRFLPDFDNVAIGHADRSRFVAEHHKKHVFLPGLVVARTILVNGRVAGTWAATRKGKAATLAIASFDGMTKKTKAAVEEEGEALLRFHEPDAQTHALVFSKSS